MMKVRVLLPLLLVVGVGLAGCVPPPPPPAPPPPPPPPLGVDVVATDIAWPAPLVEGQRVPFSITVQNVGDTATPPNTILDVLITVDGVDTGWSDNVTVPLAPGASRVQVVNGGPNGTDGLWTVTRGSHNVRAYVNSGSLPARPPIPEYNRDNNMLTEPFDVRPPTTIVFTRGGDIWSMHADGSSLFQLTTGPDIDDSPELSRDGTKIVFVRTNPDHTVFPNKSIWVMNANGTDQHQVMVSLCEPLPVTPACFGVLRDNFPTWSPDGTQIAFVRETSGPNGIWVMNADGSNSHSLLRINEPRFSYTAWSPDGTQIAYSLNYVCCDIHVAFVRADGSAAAPSNELIGPLNGADNVTFDWVPSWSPDATKIAFQGRLAFNGTTGVWVATVGGGRASAVQLTTAGESNPSFSPDGSRIAFTRGGAIWTMNADGSDQVLVAAGGDPNWGPSL